MTLAKIEIVKDADDIAKDEAVIRVVDVFDLPEEPEFRIDPLDATGDVQDATDWPAGPHEAKRMRVGEKGIELVVAAEVVSPKAFQPGASVAISIPSASIREVMDWPGGAPALPAARGGIVVNADRRRAEIAARARARRAELENLAAMRMADQATEEEETYEAEEDDEVGFDVAAQETIPEPLPIDIAPPAAAAAVVSAGAAAAAAEAVSAAALSAEEVSALPEPPLSMRSGDGLARLDERRRGRVALVASRGDLPSAVQVSAASLPIVTPLTPVMPPPDEGAAARDRSWSMPEVTPMRPVPERQQQRAVPASMSPPRRGSEPPLPNFYPGASVPANRQQGAIPATPASTSVTPPPLPLKTPDTRAGRTMTGPTPPPPSLPAHTPRFLTRVGEETSKPYAVQRAFGLGFLVAALLAFASTFVFRSEVTSLVTPAARPPVTAEVVADPPTVTTLSAILAVPEVSPRGTEAANVGIVDALKRADQQLAGSGGDREEARFWLRRALAQGLGEQRLVWAITQLGTIYASPNAGSPDYASARALWQLAAAQGDPVALCFLASLYENGLGIPKDDVRALVLYRNAKTNGGCRNVDQSIARLSKGTP